MENLSLICFLESYKHSCLNEESICALFAYFERCFSVGVLHGVDDSPADKLRIGIEQKEQIEILEMSGVYKIRDSSFRYSFTIFHDYFFQ